MTDHSSFLFDLPFSEATLPPLAGVNDRLGCWLEKFGYPQSFIEDLMAWRPDLLVGNFHPWASGEDLDLAASAYAWMIFFDDYFEGHLRDQPAQVGAIIDAHLDAMKRSVSAVSGLSASERALNDVWSRLSEGMSPSWRTRALRNWRLCLSGFVPEAENRQRGQAMAVEDHLRLRADTGGVKINLDMCERLRHAELPHPRVAAITRMNELTQHIVDSVQDVLSLDKERRGNDVNNIVLSLMAECGHTEEGAVEDVARRVRQWTDEFLALEATTPKVCDALGVSRADRVRIYKYIDSMRAFMKGVHDWCRVSLRYRSRRQPSWVST